MKINISRSIDTLVTEALRTFKRFPGVILTALVATGIAIYLLESDDENLRVFLPVLLGIPLFLASTLFRESRGWTESRYVGFELAAGAAFIAIYSYLWDDVSINLRYVQLSLALHLLVSFVATPGPGATSGFWQLNKAIFLRLLYSALYAGVFFVGLAIAITTVERLFNLKVDFNWYLDLLAISILTLQTWHFLAGLPEDLEKLKDDNSYPRGLRIFVQYLLIPLVSLYMLILYAYMAKILFTQNWPSGYVGWLVSVMSALGIFNLLLIDPEKNREETLWIRTYAKGYYILVIPLLGLLFGAVWQRVHAYGITEPRYFLIVLGLLLLGLALYFLFSKKKDIKVVPVSLFVVVCLSLWGPWSASSVSIRSQLGRARAILAEKNLLDGIAQPRTGTDPSGSGELARIYNYLIYHRGVKAFEGLYPDAVLADAQARATGNKYQRHEKMSEILLAHLGIERTEQEKRSYIPSYVIALKTSNDSINIEDFRRVIRYDSSDPKPIFDWNGRSIDIVLDRQAALLIFFDGEKVVLKVPFEARIRALRKEEKDSSSAAELTENAKGEGLEVQVLAERLSGELSEDSITLDHVRALILLK